MEALDHQKEKIQKFCDSFCNTDIKYFSIKGRIAYAFQNWIK